MAIPKPAAIPVDLDRPRTVVLDLGALCDAEEMTGTNYMLPTNWVRLSFRDLRALTLAGLRHEDPGLTVDALNGMIHPGNFHLVSEALTKAFWDAMPKAEEDGGEATEDPTKANGETPLPS